MTRETKIGLLVGLAFIIVIGILLSDHITNSVEPQPADIARAGANVRQGTGMPAPEPAPVITRVISPSVSPADPVLTRQDMVPAPSAIVVEIGHAPVPARTPAPSAAPIVTPAPAPAVSPIPAPVRVASNPPNSGASAHRADSPLAMVASHHAEELVPLNPVVHVAPRGNPANAQPGSPVAAGSVRQYKAEPGDTLSRMALKLMGSNSRANREAIIQANPTLQANPDKVIAGFNYAIPAAPLVVPASPVPAAPSVAVAVNLPGRAAVAANDPRAGAGAAMASHLQATYTVKSGDSLWKIAAEQLGDPRAVESIKQLNQEQLHGSDIVRPDMKLRLPARPQA